MAFIRSCAAACALLAVFQVATCAPAPLSDLDISVDEVSFNESETGTTLEKRKAYWGDFGEFSGGSARGYKDGEGTYIRSGDDGRYGAFGKEHCWTDYFFVKDVDRAEAWERNQKTLDCALTSSCELGTVESENRCVTWNQKTTISANVGLDLFKGLLSAGLDVTYETEKGGSQCSKASNNAGCHWDDKLCHTAWTSDTTTVAQGYIRRRCNSNGDHTVWMHDWDIEIPGKETRLGCGALCSDTSYPGPLPIV